MRGGLICTRERSQGREEVPHVRDVSQITGAVFRLWRSGASVPARTRRIFLLHCTYMRVIMLLGGVFICLDTSLM